MQTWVFSSLVFLLEPTCAIPGRDPVAGGLLNSLVSLSEEGQGQGHDLTWAIPKDDPYSHIGSMLPSAAGPVLGGAFWSPGTK